MRYDYTRLKDLANQNNIIFIDDYSNKTMFF